MLPGAAKLTGEPDIQETPWETAKYWLTIALVIAMLSGLVIMMVDGAVRNGQCTFAQFVTFECNRWDAKFKPWK